MASAEKHTVNSSTKDASSASGSELVASDEMWTDAHLEHRSRLREILRKVPRDVLWDVLDNTILPELMEHPVKVLEELVDVVEDEVGIFLNNIPPPDLNPKVMKRELSALFDDIHRLSEEAKSNREIDWEQWTATLEEIADSMKKWLSNIWLCVWEYGCSFETAHECLMIAQKHFDMLMVPKIGCICPFTTLPLCVTFKDLRGDIVREWDALSAVILQDVIFWIWRDLFMQILVKDRPGGGDKLVRSMIAEIEHTYGGCHHIILCGGASNGIGIDENYRDGFDSDDELSEDEYLDDDDDFSARYYGYHWEDMFEVFEDLRYILVEMMKTYFESHPTLHGYRTLCSIDDQDRREFRRELQDKLLENSAYSRGAALCALDVFQHAHSPISVKKVLERASHLFEAQDGPSLCSAVSFLVKQPTTKEFGLAYVEKQLANCLETARNEILWTFKLGDVDKTLEELTDIASLTLKSAKRAEKVKAWVKNALIAKSVIADPFSMAAMIFGFPGPGDEDEEENEDEEDEQTFIDRNHTLQFDGIVEHFAVTETRPKPKDLCEINERYLIKRMSEWLNMVKTLPQDSRPSKSKILFNFEKLVTQRLPWMKLSDVVAELKSQYAKRRGERHLKGMLIFLEDFLSERKAYHKRVHEAKIKKNKKAQEEATKQKRTILIDEID